MKIICCLLITSILSVLFSKYIKKYKLSLYIISTVISLFVIVHACLILNGFNVKYIPVLSQFMDAIDSGALGGSIFILVMYMGALDAKNNVGKKLRINRAELSILASIFTIPHNIHYLFAFLFNAKMILKTQGLPLFTSLMMFASGVFAIVIMIPLFITSFMYFRRKMNAKKWKNLQEFAYIFYAMVYVQVMMLYISMPPSWNRSLSLFVYTILFTSYTVLRVKKFMDKKVILNSVTSYGKKIG